MARRFWPSKNPIGQRIICASRKFRSRGLGPLLPREIVGVVGDVHHFSHESELSTEMYVPQMQNTVPFTFFLIRTASDPHRLVPLVARRVNEVLKNSPVDYVKTFDEVRAVNFSRPRFQMLLLGVFAGLALLLAMLGIYGVMAFAVTQRTHEIGIRMALGADARQVLRMVLGHAMKLALIGVVLGLAGAVASTRLMAALLYRVTPTDALTFAGVSVLIFLTAALASFLPAWRAAKTDPVSTLRSQL